MDELLQYLGSISPLSDELTGTLASRLRRETFRKNRPLLSIGQTCDWLAFIEKGLVKLCFDIPGGQERIVGFLKAGETACSIGSYHTLNPSKFAIIALEDTVIRKILKTEAEAIAQKHPSFHVHLRRIYEYQAMQLESHYLLLTEPPKERLAHLPAWMLKDKRIKDYMLADYLGIHRVSFSRLNGKSKFS